MRECFVITTYCNTPDRVEELKKCIINLNRFNKDILIHAHYPLDLEIQQLVKYYIYDSTNPVINDGSKIIVRWKWYIAANKLLTIRNPDYSYAVMNQWNSSFNFIREKKYDIIHVINYDAIINDFIFNKHSEFFKEGYDAVFEYANLHPRDFNANEISDDKLIYAVFFSVTNKFSEILSNELTLEKYLQSKDTMLETYLMEVLDKIENRYKNEKFFGLDLFKIKKFDDSQFKLYLGDSVINKVIEIKREDHDIYTTISEANGFDLVNIGYCYVFGGHNKELDRFEIFIFEISKPIYKLIININDKILNVLDINNNFYSYVTDYSMNEIHKIIDENKLSIEINGEHVDKKIIEAMKIQSIQIKYN